MSTDDESRRRREAEAIRRQQAERRRERERGRKHNEKGRLFHRGMAQMRGETRENGWKNEQRISTPFGDRVHDTARDRGGREFSEYKSGRHIRADSLLQLAKDRHILEADPNARGGWLIRVDARVDPAVQRQMDKMLALFPGRFTVEKATREEVNRAIALGKQLEKEARGQQLELFDSTRLRQQERARERAERAREIARTQEAAARAVAEKAARELRLAREAQEQALRAKMPRAPDEVINILLRSGPMPGEVVREDQDVASRGGTTRAGRNARGIERGIARER
ncbi:MULTISPECIES: hypothetical protein [unclassified Nocardia]|uniref:hypothetical protein n=1 Tax=unclassified Nocardia TaxID=2637762 RepID=UPI0024A93668|nr:MULTISPECIES: hypothetical protein [unclassified Nocardia]